MALLPSRCQIGFLAEHRSCANLDKAIGLVAIRSLPRNRDSGPYQGAHAFIRVIGLGVRTRLNMYLVHSWRKSRFARKYLSLNDYVKTQIWCSGGSSRPRIGPEGSIQMTGPDCPLWVGSRHWDFRTYFKKRLGRWMNRYLPTGTGVEALKLDGSKRGWGNRLNIEHSKGFRIATDLRYLSP
jgi:hypothetical protein